jgi:hypothetical protein
VYRCKRADLINIHTTLHQRFYSQLKNLSKLNLARFKRARGRLKGTTTSDLADVVERAKESGLSEWEMSVVSAGGKGWTGPCEEGRMCGQWNLGMVADVFRRDETTRLVNQIEVRVTILLVSSGWFRVTGTDVFVSFSALCGAS